MERNDNEQACCLDQKWKGMIMIKLAAHIFEGVLKASGCMLLMLSPLSQVTCITLHYFTLAKSQFNLGFNIGHPNKTTAFWVKSQLNIGFNVGHPGEAGFPKLNQLRLGEWSWTGRRIIVESEVTQYIIALDA